MKSNEQELLLVCLYVDDLIYKSTNPRVVEEFKNAMMQEFEMTDLDLIRYFLGIQVTQSEEGIFISQGKYIEELLKKYRMTDCKPTETPMGTNEKLSKEDGAQKVDASTYRSLVGSLIYLTNTRPDIVNAVSIVSRYMHEPGKLHCAASKRILRYVKRILASNMFRRRKVI